MESLHTRAYCSEIISQCTFLSKDYLILYPLTILCPSADLQVGVEWGGGGWILEGAKGKKE